MIMVNILMHMLEDNSGSGQVNNLKRPKNTRD